MCSFVSKLNHNWSASALTIFASICESPKNRFVSRSGWLSFTKPVEGSVYELPDNSYGMKRTEIRSVSSNIHLGHVFDDGPNGMPRYCINATVLEFKTRDEFTNVKIKESA